MLQYIISSADSVVHGLSWLFLPCLAPPLCVMSSAKHISLSRVGNTKEMGELCEKSRAHYETLRRVVAAQVQSLQSTEQ